MYLELPIFSDLWLQKHNGEQRALAEVLEGEKRQMDMACARLEGEAAALKEALEDEKKENESLRQRTKDLAHDVRMCKVARLSLFWCSPLPFHLESVGAP